MGMEESHTLWKCPNHKKFKGKDYYWCRTHKAWMNHHPNECRKKSVLRHREEKGQMTIPLTIKAKEPCSYANALNAIVTDIANGQE
jgi:hypothetical protein